MRKSNYKSKHSVKNSATLPALRLAYILLKHRFLGLLEINLLYDFVDEVSLNNTLPFWQVCPKNPGVHIQVNPSGNTGMHVPPFLHGELPHASIDAAKIYTIIYHSPTKLLEVNIFSHVGQFVCSGGPSSFCTETRSPTQSTFVNFFNLNPRTGPYPPPHPPTSRQI